MQLLMDHVDSWSAASVRRPLAWFFEAFRLLTAHSRAATIAKQAVKADNKAWNARLESRLQRAVDLCDSREAWSVCRQLAGHGPSKVYDRVVPAARLITRNQWQQQLRTVWGAWVHEEAVVVPECCEAHPMPPALAGDVGCRTLLQAAKSQARFRATPQGALPAELRQLLTQDRHLSGTEVSGLSPFACVHLKRCRLYRLQSSGMVRWTRPVTRLYTSQAWGVFRVQMVSASSTCWTLQGKCFGGLMPDSPADHQYSYAPSRSRREAILQVEAWLDRLRFNFLSTATTLFDLTKAFDILALACIEEAVEQARMPEAARAILLDLHRRLRISLPQSDGKPLQMKGVLQGGGTGPRLFRIVFDDCISRWKADTHEHSLIVVYRGLHLSVDTAASADDLVRIQSGRNLSQLESETVNSTSALRNLLAPRGLKLNPQKCETLLSLKGQGAYEDAKRAFAGSWKGYPLKLAVKYLGAHLQSNGSMQAELRKRIGAAKSGFARFARFFKRSRLPLARKVLVFKAVVNESLLSALEVRPLNVSDCHALEKSRGLLLRRLFGRQGFGAVAEDASHRSVTVESLRQKLNLSTSELRVRRLLWLRSALLAEEAGQVRLELAALFGHCDQLSGPLDSVIGVPTKQASRFLHLLLQDLSIALPSFSGFLGQWRTDFSHISVERWQHLRTWRSVEPHPRPDMVKTRA